MPTPVCLGLRYFADRPRDRHPHPLSHVNTWTRPTGSGHTLACMFCPACGTRMWHTDPDSKRISVKGGSLDVPPDLTHPVHIWTARASFLACSSLIAHAASPASRSERS